MSRSFDVVVIGAGPAGYVGAIRCAQLGLNTACVDEWRDADGNAALGGTCLNVGCIPSKALLDSTEQFHKIKHQFPAHGITVSGAEMDVAAMIGRKNSIVAGLTRGIGTLFKANKVTSIHGHGRLMPGNAIEISDVSSGAVIETVTATNVVLASGSAPIALPSAPFDGSRIVDSAGALDFEAVPARLGIVGAGVIGLELGSVWQRLGAKVTILEALDTFLPAVDKQIAREAQRQFTRQGLSFHLGARVEGAHVVGEEVQVSYSDTGGQHRLDVDRLIVAIGRRPYTDGLVHPDAGLDVDERGFVRVDGQWRTNLDGVYAAGDVIGGAMLAHKGSEEGIAVAETIAAGRGHVNYEAVPWIIYTAPEVAWVGRTEQQLSEAGIEYRSGTFPFAATGRAQAMNDPVGFVKVIAESRTDRVLGVHIIGPHASELIAEAVLAMEYSASSEDIARTIHAHPTLAEALHEAALAVDARALHKAN